MLYTLSRNIILIIILKTESNATPQSLAGGK